MKAKYYLLAALSLALWIAGLFTAHTFGGFIHILPLVAIVLVGIRILHRVYLLDDPESVGKPRRSPPAPAGSTDLKGS